MRHFTFQSTIQLGLPFQLDEAVCKPLGMCGIVDMREAVVLLRVSDACIVHAPGQPVMTVQTYLHREGSPCLDADMNQSELAVKQIDIVAEAFARCVHQLWTALAIDQSKAVACLHAAQHAYQSTLGWLFLQYFPDQIVFAGP